VSVEEAVSAYQQGNLDRRAFIRRLVGGGVSLGAAVAYAHLFAPEAGATSGSSDDFYEQPLDIAIDLRNGSLAGVRRNRGFDVHVVVTDAANVDLVAWLRKRDGRTRLGEKTVNFRRARGRVVKLPLTSQARELLSGRDRARVLITSKATFANGQIARMRDTKILT
jgi:hypothetical protein